jgi:hypothetical protein
MTCVEEKVLRRHRSTWDLPIDIDGQADRVGTGRVVDMLVGGRADMSVVVFPTARDRSGARVSARASPLSGVCGVAVSVFSLALCVVSR